MIYLLMSVLDHLYFAFANSDCKDNLVFLGCVRLPIASLESFLDIVKQVQKMMGHKFHVV